MLSMGALPQRPAGIQGAEADGLQVLYIANSFGSDWAEKGFPTAKGE
jgi:hypothetical protein